jgi:hypothetical protein
MTPHQVETAMKRLSGEATDVPTNLLGRGKNLEVLEAAKKNAPSMEAPAYPKNVQQDDLAKAAPTETGFTMVPEGSQVPAVVPQQTVLPKSGAKSPSQEILDEMGDQAPDAKFRNPTYETQAKPQSMADMETNAFRDVDLEDKPNNMLKKLLVGGGVAAGGAGLINSMMGDDQEASAQVPYAPKSQQPKVSDPVSAQPQVKALSAAQKANVKANPLESKGGNATQAIPERKEGDYTDLMRQAQAGKSEQDFVNNMLRAGTTAGAALAYQKPDYTAVDALSEQSGQGVENVKQAINTEKAQAEINDERSLRDPGSDVSKAFRSALAKLGIPHTEKTSANDAKNMGINIQNLIMQQEHSKQARDMKELMLGDRAKGQAYSSVDRNIQNMRNGAAYKAYQNTKNASDALDNAVLTGDKVAAGTAFLRSAKVAQGDDSVVRSDDMKVLLGGRNYTPAAYAEKMADLVKGKNITDRELKAMQNIMGMVKNLEGSRVYQQVSPIIEKIKNNGLNHDEFMHPDEVSEFNQYGQSNKQAPTSQQFPMQVRKAGKVATVSNAQELQEAQKEGWQ